MRDDDSEILLSRRRMLGLTGAALLMPLISAKSTFGDVAASLETPYSRFMEVEGKRPQRKTTKESVAYLKSKFNLDTKNLSPIKMPQANFSGLSFPRGIDFSGSDLRGANFRNCSFEDVNFDRANLQGAIFDDAGMEASFKNAKLNGASFFNCYLKNAVFDSASLASVPYEISGKQYLKRTSFDMAKMNIGNFRDADLRGVTLKYADMQYTSFRGATIGTVTVEQANAQFPTFFQNSNMSHTDLRDLDLAGVPLISSRLDFAHLQGANLSGSMFGEGGSMWRADLRRANLNKAMFIFGNSPYNLQEANLERANLRDANFSKAAFSDLTRFKGAIYNKKTKWPEGFSPTGKGLILKD